MKTAHPAALKHAEFVAPMRDYSLRDAVNLAACYRDLHARHERLLAAMERVNAMAVRPTCICGITTGMAAIRACTDAALRAELEKPL